MAGLIGPYYPGIGVPGGKIVPTIPSSQIRINSQHPLANGLLMAYLPGVSGVDYAGLSGLLANRDNLNAVASPGVFGMTPEGPGITGTTAANFARSVPAGGTQSTISTWTGTSSFYVRLFQKGTTGVDAWPLLISSASLVSMALNSTGAGSNVYQLRWGAFVNSAGTVTVGNNAMHGMLGVNVPNPGPAILYADGVANNVSVVLTAPTLTKANAVISVAAGPDQVVTLIYVWGRTITAKEAAELEQAPYGLFAPVYTSGYMLAGKAPDDINFIASPEEALPQDWGPW